MSHDLPKPDFKVDHLFLPACKNPPHVRSWVGDNLIESVITRRSADELELKAGDQVMAVVKATDVMIQKD